MSKTLTIHLSDADYEAVRAAAEQANQSPEELIATAAAERFGAKSQSQSAIHESREAFIAALRAQGLLADTTGLPPYPGTEDLPPPGSPEEAQLLKDIGDELSDALEQSGLSILDLIERR
jgi:hypothetical protein